MFLDYKQSIYKISIYKRNLKEHSNNFVNKNS